MILTCEMCGASYLAESETRRFCDACRKKRKDACYLKNRGKYQEAQHIRRMAKPRDYAAGVDRNGCVALAAAIVRLQFATYEAALQKYASTGSEGHLRQLKLIEKEILTPYYCTLTLRVMDMREYIAYKRKEYGLPWEDVIKHGQG